MSENPKLSIITVNLNNRDGLQHTIDSVVSQTFTDYEWIIIDGGSTDGSRELIEQYQDHFAYWCSEPDKGIYNAMNKGIAHTKGEWLQFLNSGDCLFEPTTLSKVFLQKHNADILYGNYKQYSGDTIVDRIVTEKITLSYLLEFNICHQSSFLKKNIFSNRRYNESYKITSDWLLFLQLVFENSVFEFVPLFIACCEKDGTTYNNIDIALFEREQIKEKYIPYHIKDDIKSLLDYKEKESNINSHKIYRILNKNAERRIKIAEKIIKLIERLKSHNILPKI